LRPTKWLALLACFVLALGVAACGDDEESGGGGGSSDTAGGGGDLSGKVTIDGSSTVQPFAEAAAELFNEENPGVDITVGGSGTGDGFEKFCRGETDISDASRPIEEEETAACKMENITATEVQVANDGVAVVTNKALSIPCAKTEELKALFESGAKTKTYADANPQFPAEEISLFTPGPESGTFEFFAEEINEQEKMQREDNVQTSSDDNVIITGVSGEENAIGYLGFSFYEQNQDKLNVIDVDSGSGCVKPSLETIQSGEYKPLARPLFMYPSAEKAKRPEVKAFLDFAVENHQEISEAAQIVPMTEEQASKSKQAIEGA